MGETARVIAQATPQVKEQTLSFNMLLSQVQNLKAKNEWNHILAILYPLDKKQPHLLGDPNVHQLLAEIAFALSQLHRFDEAIKLLKQCLDLQPGSYLYISGLAFNYYNCLMCEKSREFNLGERRQQYWEQADKAFAEAEQAFPESVVDFYRHGMLYHALSQNSDKKAIPYFLKAIENWEAMDEETKKARHKDFKNYIKALYHLAKAYLNLGEGEKAIDAIMQCIREDEATDHEEPVHKFYIAGCAFAEEGNYTEAIKYLRVAANQKTKRPKDYIYVELARTCAALNDCDTACSWIERIPPKFRKPYALRLYGEILARMGKVAQAEQQFREALKMDRQGKHKTLFAWGKMYFQQKNYATALRHFEQANSERRKAFAAEYADALYYCGLCQRELGRKEEAVQSLRRALALNDRHEKAARALRELNPSQSADDNNDEDVYTLYEEAYQCVKEFYESEHGKPGD